MGAEFINKSRGETHHCAKLTETKVKAMRRLHYDKGICIRCIAIFYDTTYSAVWEATRFVTWAHVPYDGSVSGKAKAEKNMRVKA